MTGVETRVWDEMCGNQGVKQLQVGSMMCKVSSHPHINYIYTFTQISLTWDACRLHARGGVHRVAEDAELGQLGADQAAEVGTRGQVSCTLCLGNAFSSFYRPQAFTTDIHWDKQPTTSHPDNIHT